MSRGSLLHEYTASLIAVVDILLVGSTAVAVGFAADERRSALVELPRIWPNRRRFASGGSGGRSKGRRNGATHLSWTEGNVEGH